VITVPVDIEQLTERIIGCAIEVHKTMEAERCVTLTYRELAICSRLRLDIIVEGLIVVELKSIEQIHPIHLSQVITYLRLTDWPVGLLMNFNVTSMRHGVRRLYHPSWYSAKKTSKDQAS
jgi:hypothetical protein